MKACASSLRHRCIVAAVAVLLSSVLALGASCGGERQFSEALQAKLNRAVDSVMKKYQIPGAIVGAWVPGEGEWVVTKGKANTDTGVPPRTSDHVRIASISKTFTATVIIQLVDDGELSLDDKLEKFDLGVEVPNSDRITVRNLLNMTSGLYNYTDDEDFGEELIADPTKAWTPEEMVEISNSHGPVSEPGQGFQYCNTNYILLGMIIEEVTGSDLGGEIKSRIFDDLELKNTSYPTGTSVSVPYMHGYMPDPGTGDPGGPATEDITTLSPTMGGAAGTIISDLADLRTWAEALGSGTLLSEDMHREQLSFEPPNTESYGLGVMNARVMVGHSGEIPGYNNSMYTQPEENGATVIVLVNRYPSEVEGASDQVLLEILEVIAPLIEGEK